MPYELLSSAYIRSIYCVVHRFPWQVGKLRRIDTQYHLEPFPPFRGQRSAGPVASRDITRSQ